ncbi:MAG: terpene cyclase/mutase family protein, partial [Thermoplasmata archaeon]|nr:terpene cyclase/mutase family protein [Thermoplasmata archaeon]
ETWQQALVFLRRCQNLPEVNDLDWDDDEGDPNFADGGFVYFPGRSNAGGLISYGSMTAAGLWGLLAAGETTSGPSASAALSWLGENFDVSENPGFSESAYYYYAWTLARAFRTAGAPALETPSGDLLAWAVELADEMLDRQSLDGAWRNGESSAYWEGDPIVATCFALLGIEALMPAEDASLRISAPDGGKVRVTDPMGRKDAEIPGWVKDEDGSILLGDASLGPFSVEVEGSESVEISSEKDGRVRVIREIGLARDGGKMTVDVAPLLGPASLVITGIAALPASSSTTTTPGAGVMMALVAVIVLAAVAAVVVRRGPRKER